ncbi:MAG: YdeI/OmpD-associated family protein [Myxococcota bacterium]
MATSQSMALRAPFDSIDRVEITSAEELRSWLRSNHQREEGIALVTFKKHVRQKYVSTDEVLDELLCFGWIDGARCKLDDDRTMQLISPRRTQHWSKTYKDRVQRLEGEGRMEQPGRAAVADAKRSGLWTFMDDVDALVVPHDLARALEAYPGASEHFSRAAPSYRRNVLRWIKLAKTAATRRKRIEKSVAYAERNERLPQM